MFISQQYLQEEYVNKRRTVRQIAEALGTSTMTVIKHMKLYNIGRRSRSEAQKNSLDSGQGKHPTKGKSRPRTTREKISNSVSKYWREMEHQEYSRRVNQAKTQWENMDAWARKRLQQLAAEGKANTSREGSSLEKALFKLLLEQSFLVDFHWIHPILGNKHPVDLYLPELKVAIVVDGPTHFFPMNGDQALYDMIVADKVRFRTLMDSDIKIIRIKNLDKNRSKHRVQALFKQILSRIEYFRYSDKAELVELELNDGKTEES